MLYTHHLIKSSHKLYGRHSIISVHLENNTFYYYFMVVQTDCHMPQIKNLTVPPVGGGTVRQWLLSVYGCAHPSSVALVQSSDPEGEFR